jgi:hypothetical protein
LEATDQDTHIVSHNVWFGGKVPERFRDRLPQTHTLIPNPPMAAFAFLPTPWRDDSGTITGRAPLDRPSIEEA